MKVEIDTRDMDALAKKLNDLSKRYKGEKRAMFERAGELLKKHLDESIDAKLNDEHGRVKSWQQVQVGSKGGYAAIRPIKKPKGKDGPGAITGYLESGHRIRRPSGKAKSKARRRINVPYVSGRYFYRDTAKQMETEAEKLANEFAETIAKDLEG